MFLRHIVDGNVKCTQKCILRKKNYIYYVGIHFIQTHTGMRKKA